jgi:glycosyltransferase involved in cell wall biosynthesis
VPRLSVLLPFRNAAATIEEALDSTLAQTLRDFEIVSVDDGSSDRSRAIVERFASKDRRLKVIDSPGRGLVAALNGGLAATTTEFVARMDADDIMLPERLRLQSEFLRDHPDVAVVGCQVEVFPDERIGSGYREYVRWQNLCVTSEEIADNIYVESPFAHPSVTLRREAIVAAGGYQDGDFPEDYELWLRLNAMGHRMAKIPELLLRWRESSDRTSRVDGRYSRGAFDRLRAEYLARDPRLHAQPLVYWGAGRKTRLREKLLIERGFPPTAWIDIDPKKIGRTVGGVEVHPPEWLVGREPRPLVLVYVTNHGARKEIAARLDSYGYRVAVDYLCVG